MRLAAVVAQVEQQELQPVFGGGTSLSKAYGLIQRFSEDLDFRLRHPDRGTSRRERSRYRSRVVEAIRVVDDWTIVDDDILVRNESRFFSCPVRYEAGFTAAPALRPWLKLDITFAAPTLPTETRALRSFVASARGEEPEAAAIACVAPEETAADKLSALTWRVLSRRHSDRGDDPALVRHLHDLAALEPLAAAHPRFPDLVHRLLDDDIGRVRDAGSVGASGASEFVAAGLDRLAHDPRYAEEYDSFVLAMSYGRTGETPSFQDALKAADRLQARLR